MHLGVFPNYTQLTDTQGTASITPFNHPDAYLPFGFDCGVPACADIKKGAKPYQGPGISMDCTDTDTTCCYPDKGTPSQVGNYCWGNGSVRYPVEKK